MPFFVFGCHFWAFTFLTVLQGSRNVTQEVSKARKRTALKGMQFTVLSCQCHMLIPSVQSLGVANHVEAVRHAC
ncbi:hypothetical protein BC830DRAFT_1091995 [Chytriomyces sp. MP71]|nr:hypothetical protein BC830DRAFT_1091995 [Chytriomyces sp. MP71]